MKRRSEKRKEGKDAALVISTLPYFFFLPSSAEREREKRRRLYQFSFTITFIEDRGKVRGRKEKADCSHAFLSLTHIYGERREREPKKDLAGGAQLERALYLCKAERERGAIGEEG